MIDWYHNSRTGCVPPEPRCNLNGLCIGNSFHVEEGQALNGCVNICKNTPRCRWFSFVEPGQSTKSSCILLHDCNTLDETLKGCVSGERRCKTDGM